MSNKEQSAKEKNKDTNYNSDITNHDLKILGQDNRNLRKDGGDDKALRDRNDSVDFAGKKLDVPGRTQAKKGNGPNDLNDEENKLHSQGGPGNEHLEEKDGSLR
tara:strand:- start:291 stop:602 length:312 start_codon:yes stop_codon:yes gene_type:complete